MDKLLVCNGLRECADGSDEWNCCKLLDIIMWLDVSGEGEGGRVGALQ